MNVQLSARQAPIESVFDTVCAIMRNFRDGDSRAVLRGSIMLDDRAIYELINKCVLNSDPSVLAKSTIYTCRWTDKEKLNIIFVPTDIYYSNPIAIANLSNEHSIMDNAMIENYISIVPFNYNESNPVHIARVVNYIFDSFITLLNTKRCDAYASQYLTLSYMLKDSGIKLTDDNKRDIFNIIFMDAYDYDVVELRIPTAKADHYIKKVETGPFETCISAFKKYFYDKGFEISAAATDNFDPETLIPSEFSRPEKENNSDEDTGDISQT